MTSKIKIGILVDDLMIYNWEFKMLEKVSNNDFVEFVYLLENDTINNYQSFFSRVSKLFWNFYKLLDRIYFKTIPDAFSKRNITELFLSKKLDFLKIANCHERSENLLDLQNAEIDLIIQIGDRLPNYQITRYAKYGIWYYHHGNYPLVEGNLQATWEVLNGDGDTQVTLYMINSDFNNEIIINTSFSCTDEFSINRNRNNCFWNSVTLMSRSIKELHLKGDGFIKERLSYHNHNIHFNSQKIYKTPGNLTLLKILLKKYALKVAQRIESILYIYQWILLFNIKENHRAPYPIYNFTPIFPPKDRIWADPFVMKWEGSFYIFFEEMYYRGKKGHISVIKMEYNGKISSPQVVIENEYHMSYPFIFNDDGFIYMIPETSQAKRIELYKCIDFPLKWKKEKILIDNIDAVDTTLHVANGKYWLFANVKEVEGASYNDELHLYYADKLDTTDWTPHPNNPIVSDVRRSRPAGRLFQYNNKVYRPSQNCSKHYGYGMNILQVTRLSESEFQESIVEKIFPDWNKNAISTHTVNSDQELIIIDALFKRWRYL